MRPAIGALAAISLFVTTLPLSAADERDGWYIYWGDNVIFGGPYQSEAICKTVMRDDRHIPRDASCEIIIYRNGLPVSGTQNDLEKSKN